MRELDSYLFYLNAPPAGNVIASVIAANYSTLFSIRGKGTHGQDTDLLREIGNGGAKLCQGSGVMVALRVE